MKTLPLCGLLLVAACAGNHPGSAAESRPSAASSAPAAPTVEELQALGIYNLGHPRPGLFTAGQIQEEQVRALAGRNVRLINLRADGEPGTGWEEKLAAELGIEYVHLPIAGADDIDEEHACQLGEVLQHRPPGAVDLLYCGSSNRVGALLGLTARVVDGMEPEAAYQLGVAAGATRLRPLLRQRLGLPPN